MRYTIGAKCVNSFGIKIEGIYICGKYGLPYILDIQNVLPDYDDRMFIFDNLDDALAYIKSLRKDYEYEFRSTVKRYNLELKDFGFYPLKFDSLKFKNIKLEDYKTVKKESFKLYNFTMEEEYSTYE